MNNNIKKFIETHGEQIKIAAVIGTQLIGVCALCAVVAVAARAETLNTLHIKDVIVDEKLIGLNINGVFWGHK